jgi:hypothetical protein
MVFRFLNIIIFLVALVVTGNTYATAQRINFGLHAGTGLTLQKGNVEELDFNLIKSVITPGTESVDIPKISEVAAVVLINGRSDLDVTVSIVADPNLVLGTHEIPLTVRFAYFNMGGNVTEEHARQNSIEVPSGFNYATFPILRRASGPPGPPPTPDHVGFLQPTGTAYLIIYGTMGNVPLNAAAGLYEADINVTVEYTTPPE